MTKTVVIVNKIVKNVGGSYLVNYEGILTDELDRKRAVKGSFAVSDEGNIPTSMRADVRRKLGYEGFTMTETPVPLRRPVLQAR